MCTVQFPLRPVVCASFPVFVFKETHDLLYQKYLSTKYIKNTKII